MRSILVWAFTLAALGGASLASAVVIDLVPVGNPGNASIALGPFPAVGSVGYSFNIGRTEITNAQYTEFLNAADPTGANTHSLYSTFMSSSPFGNSDTGGIDFSAGAANGSKYTVKAGKGNQPVIWVSWNDAARFSNWMTNGQGASTTETGSYDMALANPVRLPGAIYVIPNQNEWIKAGHYDPAKPGGAGYWTYATRSGTVPTSAAPPSTANSANTRDSLGAYALTGSTSLDSTLNYLTNVGAYTDALSAYNTLDQNGNVYEWNEDLATSTQRILRGGGWDRFPSNLQASAFQSLEPNSDGNGIGFRVAVVPEPATVSLILLGSGMLSRRRRAN
jgi:formylglycine-generating enzyme required for sulfatase activity